MSAGINYTIITSGTTDWSGVSNSVYFYDLVDKLPHYKDSTGTILEVFSSSGSTGSSAFTGGTVTGATTFTNGLTANTISATTYVGDGSGLTNVPTPYGTIYAISTGNFLP
jgi:hypothetical protein